MLRRCQPPRALRPAPVLPLGPKLIRGRMRIFNAWPGAASSSMQRTKIRGPASWNCRYASARSPRSQIVPLPQGRYLAGPSHGHFCRSAAKLTPAAEASITGQSARRHRYSPRSSQPPGIGDPAYRATAFRARTVVFAAHCVTSDIRLIETTGLVSACPSVPRSNGRSVTAVGRRLIRAGEGARPVPSVGAWADACTVSALRRWVRSRPSSSRTSRMSARSRLAVLELAAGQVGSISPARADHEQAAIPLQTHSTEVSSAADLAGAKAPLQSSGSRRCCSAATFALDADSRPRIRETPRW